MILSFEGDRKKFLALLEENKGIFIFKFTAEWCNPCQTIKPQVDELFHNIISDKIICLEIDVDECFDIYAFMKTKKMIKGIPTLMAYKKGNTNFHPDDSISGTDMKEINAFFERCKKM